MITTKYLLSISLIALTCLFVNQASANSAYSVTSLTLLCSSKTEHQELACITYLHGVVETWMLKDIISVDPVHYKKSGNGEFCETILKVSDQEWLNIIRSNLNKMEQGFAAPAVMRTLSNNLCDK